DAPLQRAGHGQMVATPDGQFYHTHLCSRPLPGMRRSPLGRETAIQKIEWGADGWPHLAHGGQVPAVDVPAPCETETPPQKAVKRHEFNKPDLPPEFQWLRTPYPERIFSLTARPGYLRLFG